MTAAVGLASSDSKLLAIYKKLLKKEKIMTIRDNLIEELEIQLSSLGRRRIYQRPRWMR